MTMTLAARDNAGEPAERQHKIPRQGQDLPRERAQRSKGQRHRHATHKERTRNTAKVALSAQVIGIRHFGDLLLSAYFACPYIASEGVLS